MKNKVYLKKVIIVSSLFLIVFVVLNLMLNNYFYKKYTENYNKKVSQIIYVLKEKYPELTDTEIANVINYENNSIDLEKYGININEESIVLENDKISNDMFVLNTLLFLLFFIIIIFIYIKYSNDKDKKINEINRMVEEISIGNYEIDFNNKSEDELSIFRDNLYKITLKLKEESENTLKDKKELKESLENISHQLKTPLTAMSISIDNILESKNIKDEKRREFLIDIKKEINNINFFIKNLLQLSRFEVNVVNFERKEYDILEIIKASLQKIELLRDLKNIQIELKEDNAQLYCDYNWEIEAITNIVKNAIEHSKENNKIIISITKNNTYISVKISNNGSINNEDLENIFKRFYKGKNSIKDSTGIGLSLSKSIIEKDNGKIFVKCENNCTTFEIKYYFV